MSKVLDYLYVSGYAFASNQMLLTKHRITHIVNMTHEYANAFPEQFSYLRIPAQDYLRERLGPYFREISEFIDKGKARNNRVLVHCQLGVSRSATAVLAALMINERMGLQEAFDLLKSAKNDVEPNVTFLRELRMLEFSLFGEYTREKLTVLDRVDDIRLLGWKESLATTLAISAMSKKSFDPATEQCVIIWDAFKTASRGDEKELQTFIFNVIESSIDSYGGQSEKDCRARDTLESILTIGLSKPQSNQQTLLVLLRNVAESEQFQELKIDAPVSDRWIQNFTQKLESGMD
jgi:protein-tyrosine phosphatase